MKAYTLVEVSELISIPISNLRKFIKLGTLKAVKIGKHWRITEEQLKEFLDSNTKK